MAPFLEDSSESLARRMFWLEVDGQNLINVDIHFAYNGCTDIKGKTKTPWPNKIFWSIITKHAIEPR